MSGKHLTYGIPPKKDGLYRFMALGLPQYTADIWHLSDQVDSHCRSQRPHPERGRKRWRNPQSPAGRSPGASDRCDMMRLFPEASISHRVNPHQIQLFSLAKSTCFRCYIVLYSYISQYCEMYSIYIYTHTCTYTYIHACMHAHITLMLASD